MAYNIFLNLVSYCHFRRKRKLFQIMFGILFSKILKTSLQIIDFLNRLKIVIGIFFQLSLLCFSKFEKYIVSKALKTENINKKLKVKT